MDKQQVANWERQLKIRKVAKANAGLALSPLSKRVLAGHEALLAKVQGLLDDPAGRSEGATLQKSKEEKRAVAAALPVANALYLLHREDKADEKGSEKAHALRRNKSDYDMPAALALAETRNVAKQAKAMEALLLSESEIEKDDLKELDAANMAFGDLLAAPKLAIEEGKTALKALGAALKAADKYVESDVRPMVKSVRRKFPDFAAALLEAMRIDDAAGARKDPPAAPATPTTPAPGGGSPA